MHVHKIFRFLYSVLLLSSISVSYGDTADDFLQAYFLVQGADAAEKGGDKEKAAEQYSAALKIFQRIQQVSPDWNQNIITYRIKYCTDHILKDGGKLPVVETSLAKATVAKSDISIPAASSEVTTEKRAPINTVPAGATFHKTSVENEVSAAVSAHRAVSDDRDKRIETLEKENNSLKTELAETQNQLQLLVKDFENLKTAHEGLKKELEEARVQLKNTLAASTSSTEELQTLQKENTLLRAIADRQYNEDNHRQEVGDQVTKSLEELKARLIALNIEDSRRLTIAEQVAKGLEELKAQLDALKAPLSPLSEEEKKTLHAPSIQMVSNDSTKLNATIKAEDEKTEQEAEVQPEIPSVEYHGKIAIINTKENFVVVNFYPGKVPPAHSEMGVYRGDSLVGSVRITEPIKPPVAPADIMNGNLQRGDEVR